jgi:hypothetical protein
VLHQELERQGSALFGTVDDDDVDAALDSIRELQTPLGNRIAEGRAVTLEGIRAKAATLVA